MAIISLRLVAQTDYEEQMASTSRRLKSLSSDKLEKHSPEELCLNRTTMRADDERSKNLVLRLFSYSTRPERKPIEDYCTEALAWCLTECPSLLTTMLPASASWLGSDSTVLQVDTQLPYDSKLAEGSDKEASDNGRFDLVVNGGLPEQAVIVIESKIESDFSSRQLERYHTRLRRPDSFPGVAIDRRYLVTLTISRQTSAFIQGSIIWPEVHRAISTIKNDQLPHAAAVFGDFADFLKKKGLSMLELKSINDRLITNWFEVKELEEQLRTIVERLRISEEVRPIVGRRQVKQDGNEWVGVYGTNAFYAGFGFFRGNRKAQIVIWLEVTLPGDRRNLIEAIDPQLKTAFEDAKPYLKLSDDDEAMNFGNLTTKGASRFVFVEPIEGKLNGDGEETFRCLLDLARKIIALPKKKMPSVRKS